MAQKNSMMNMFGNPQDFMYNLMGKPQAPSYGYGATGLNLNDYLGIVSASQLQPVIQPTNILSSDDDDTNSVFYRFHHFDHHSGIFPSRVLLQTRSRQSQT